MVLIKSLKKDIKINGVSFKAAGAGDDFQTYIPVQYTLSPVTNADKKVKPGQGQGDETVYKLRITYTPCEREDKYGDFIIQTNLPDKPEIRVSGTLEAKKTQ